MPCSAKPLDHTCNMSRTICTDIAPKCVIYTTTAFALKKRFVCRAAAYDEGIHSSGSSGRVRGGARNMKSMRPPLAAIFLWPIFTGPGGPWPPWPPPGSATDSNLTFYFTQYLFPIAYCMKLDIRFTLVFIWPVYAYFLRSQILWNIERCLHQHVEKKKERKFHAGLLTVLSSYSCTVIKLSEVFKRASRRLQMKREHRCGPTRHPRHYRTLQEKYSLLTDP